MSNLNFFRVLQSGGVGGEPPTTSQFTFTTDSTDTYVPFLSFNIGPTQTYPFPNNITWSSTGGLTTSGTGNSINCSGNTGNAVITVVYEPTSNGSNLRNVVQLEISTTDFGITDIDWSLIGTSLARIFTSYSSLTSYEINNSSVQTLSVNNVKANSSLTTLDISDCTILNFLTAINNLSLSSIDLTNSSILRFLSIC